MGSKATSDLGVQQPLDLGAQWPSGLGYSLTLASLKSYNTYTGSLQSPRYSTTSRAASTASSPATG